MKSIQFRIVRFVVGIILTLSLAILPVLSQQAIAGNHVNNDPNLSFSTGMAVHSSAKSGSCEENSNSLSTKNLTNCCGMSFSHFQILESSVTTDLQFEIFKYFKIAPEQLASCITSRLLRPPRVWLHTRNLFWVRFLLAQFCWSPRNRKNHESNDVCHCCAFASSWVHNGKSSAWGLVISITRHFWREIVTGSPSHHTHGIHTPWTVNPGSMGRRGRCRSTWRINGKGRL